MSDAPTGQPEANKGRGDRCQRALDEISGVLARIASKERIVIADVLDVYRIASESGAFESSEEAASEACDAVKQAGSEFLMLADAAERYQDNAEALNSWLALIREAAKSWMTNGTVPEWADFGGPFPYRP